LFRNAILAMLQLAGPPIATALLVGVVVGVLQTVTQVTESSISFVLKLIAICLTVTIAGPYMLNRSVEYTRHTIGSITDVVR
jgi:flagellar biosynthetic protein FliQ